MTTYPFPGWRRVLFVAVLVVVIVISLAPSVTQGTVTLRIYSLSAPSVVNHIYVGFTKVQFHEAGLPNSTGWTTVMQGFPNIDLLSGSQQLIPQEVTSAQINSGRYDSVKLVFSNSTISLGGRNIAVSPPSSLNANVTLPVPPNGIGDLLIIVAFDYSTVFASAPSLSFTLVRASSA